MYLVVLGTFAVLVALMLAVGGLCLFPELRRTPWSKFRKALFCSRHS